LIFGETLGNPGLEVLDIPAIAEIAHDAGLPLLVDWLLPGVQAQSVELDWFR